MIPWNAKNYFQMWMFRQNEFTDASLVSFPNLAMLPTNIDHFFIFRSILTTMTYILAPLAKMRCVTFTSCIGWKEKSLWIKEFASLQDLHFGHGKGVPDSKISLMKRPQPFTKQISPDFNFRNLIFHHDIELGIFASYFSKWSFVMSRRSTSLSYSISSAISLLSWFLSLKNLSHR